MTTYYQVQPQLPVQTREAVAPFVAIDIGVGAVTKSITGVVYDVKGAPVLGATVKLKRDLDDMTVDQTASDATTGEYTFLRDALDPNTFHVEAYSIVGGVTQIHGTSQRGLVPS